MYYSIMPKNPKSNETTLHPNTSASDSLRTTIPKFIKDQFNLAKGDMVLWKISDSKRQLLSVELINLNNGER